jgi:hypothetical protein
MLLQNQANPQVEMLMCIFELEIEKNPYEV